MLMLADDVTRHSSSHHHTETSSPRNVASTFAICSWQAAAHTWQSLLAADISDVNNKLNVQQLVTYMCFIATLHQH
jgi:hypothetical protein